MSDSDVASPAIADSTVSEVSVEGAWSIGPRLLPPPAGASEELRAILGATASAGSLARTGDRGGV